MAKKVWIIHPGKQKVETPAQTAPVYNEETGAYDAVEVEPATVETIEIPQGNSFGRYQVRVPYLVDAKEAKTLADRGFKEISETTAKKYQGKALQGESYAIGEDELEASERERAMENQGGAVSLPPGEDSTTKESKRGGK